jgi:hypothetical protein
MNVNRGFSPCAYFGSTGNWPDSLCGSSQPKAERTDHAGAACQPICCKRCSTPVPLDAHCSGNGSSSSLKL